MPKVGNKTFPYTKKGRAQAKAAKKKASNKIKTVKKRY